MPYAGKYKRCKGIAYYLGRILGWRYENCGYLKKEEVE